MTPSGPNAAPSTWETLHEHLRETNHARRQAMAETLSRLVRINTVRDASLPDANQAAMDEALAIVEQLCPTLGLAYRSAAGGRVGLIEAGSGSEVLGVLAHMDVVPAGEGWERGAFSGDIVGGEVWGRGTQDDKGPLVSALYALAAVADLGLPWRRRVRLIIGTQEETGLWGDLEAHFAVEAPPDLSFAADAQFPVINAEKGFSNISVSWDCAPAEEAGTALLALDAGVAPNMVADSAWAALATGGRAAEVAALVDQYNAGHDAADVAVVGEDDLPADRSAWRGTGADCFLHATGRTAHGATPEAGHSALLDLCELLEGVQLAPTAAGHMAAFISRTIGQELDGRTLGIAATHEIMGSTTVNVGLVRTEGSRCAATLNIRFPLGLTSQDILAAVQAAVARHPLPGAEASVVVITALEPLYVPADTEIVRTLSEVYTAMTGRPAELLSVGGTTYAKAVPNAVSFGPQMRDEAGREHQPNERVTVDSLVRAADIYAAAVAHLCLVGPSVPS